MYLVKEIDIKQYEDCFKLDSESLNIWNKNQWESEFKKKGVKVFGIYNQENEIIGLTSIQLIAFEIQINFLSIKIGYREKGLGRELVNHILNYSKQFKVERIFLEVSNKNKPALRFYDSFGFNTLYIRKNYYKDGSDAILKEKKL